LRLDTHTGFSGVAFQKRSIVINNEPLKHPKYASEIDNSGEFDYVQNIMVADISIPPRREYFENEDDFKFIEIDNHRLLEALHNLKDSSNREASSAHDSSGIVTPSEFVGPEN
jgi:hypothetical protein